MAETSMVADNRWEEFQNMLATRETCSRECDYYDKCPLMPVVKAQGVYTCIVKGMSLDEKRKFMNFFVGGQQGLRDEIMLVLYDFTNTLDLKDPKEAKSYIDLLLRVHREFYSVKKDDNKVNRPLTVTISETEGKRPREKTSPIRDTVDEDPESLLNSPDLEELVRLRKEKTCPAST
jgi:hypothetical protein